MNSDELKNLKNRYDIAGNDHTLNYALEMAVKIAPTDVAVLVMGETGVGKENIPRIIKEHSRRRFGKYFALNCATGTESLIDSELFGHEKGAFTGAVEQHKGYFEEADGGTLFLDEVGELPLPTQAKLLRVLQNGEFMRVGSSKVLKTDVRIIAATNLNLAHAVKQGKFRADLYYRLRGVCITLPSLRDRPDDIPLLFRKFMSDFSERNHICKIDLTHEAVALLKSYRWPGNIRELKNVAEAVCACESREITPGAERLSISAEILSNYMPEEDAGLPSLVTYSDDFLTDVENLDKMKYIIKELAREVAALSNKVNELSAPAKKNVIINTDGRGTPEMDEEDLQNAIRDAQKQDDETLDYVNDVQKKEEDAPESAKTIEESEKEQIMAALERNKKNKKNAAKELGISERTLYRRLKEYGLQ